MRQDRRDSMAGNPQQVAHCSNQTPNQNAIQGHILIDNASRISYTAQKGINPPATLRMAQNTERAIFPLHGAAKENRIFTQLSFCCFITITFLLLVSKEKRMGSLC